GVPSPATSSRRVGTGLDSRAFRSSSVPLRARVSDGASASSDTLVDFHGRLDATMTTPTTTIETTLEDGCATLWLNRPERLNALNVELIDAACEQLAAWGIDPAVRVIVIRGRGRS